MVGPAMPAVIQKTFQTRVELDGSSCLIRVPFDPVPVFGKVRAPVTVTLNGYSYRSTIASMGDGPCLPLRRSHREAAGLSGGETVKITLTLDQAPRTVDPPADLARAMKAAGLTAAWDAMSYTHKREHVEAIEQARKPETRARRIAAAVAMVGAKAKKPAPARAAATRPARAKPGPSRSAATASSRPTPRSAGR